jgi:hypothetical protein
LIGYAPFAVSPLSMTQSVPSNTAFETSPVKVKQNENSELEKVVKMQRLTQNRIPFLIKALNTELTCLCARGPRVDNHAVNRLLNQTQKHKNKMC